MSPAEGRIAADSRKPAPVVVPFFISHLGCPHRCVFCDQEKIAGAASRLPSAAEIAEQVELYRQSSKGREMQAAFYGGTFTSLLRERQHYLLEALQPFLHAGTIRSIRLSTRPDAVDPSTLAFLREMGVTTVELGVQSMDEEVLRLSRRGHTAQDAERAIREVREAGMEVGVQLMTGLPGDTPARSLESLRKILRLHPSLLRIYPSLVISGTELAARYREGEYAPQTLEEAVELCADLLLLAEKASVPVVRLGLQATAELGSPEVVLAGPYHPAFGQLVESELCYRLMGALAAGVAAGSEVSFFSPPGRISDLVGQGRRNLARLAREHAVKVSAVREDATLRRSEIAMQSSHGRKVADLGELP